MRMEHILGQKKPTSFSSFLGSNIGVWCLFDLNTSTENQQRTVRDTHTNSCIQQREYKRIERWNGKKKKKKKKKEKLPWRERWLCSWLLFAAAAAGGLFFGFFWALLTRQKIKKLYLCLPLTPPPSTLDPITPSRRETNTTTTHERERTKQVEQQPEKPAAAKAICRGCPYVNVQGSCYVVVVVSDRGRTDDGGLSPLCSLPLHHHQPTHYTDHTT